MCVGSPSLLQGGDFGVEKDRRHLWHLANWDSPLPSGPPGAWVPASWIGEPGLKVQSAPSQPDLMEDLHGLLQFCCSAPQDAEN